MSFKTKTDLSFGRQVKKDQNSLLILPGTTQFGNEQEDLITGPDLNKVRVLIPSVDNITSTFTGNTNTGIYTYSFGVADMAEAESEITHFTLQSEIGEEQFIGPVWVGRDPVDVNGTQVYTRYEGIQFDLTLAEINDLGDGNVSGSTRSTYEKLEADPLDYNGDFIWVDVRGTTRTKNLIIESVGSGASTMDIGLDANGNVVNVASDERLKENFQPIQNALEKVLGLEGVMYNWKDREAGTDAMRIGFRAQQIKDIVPELVYETNDGYYGVHYNNVVPLIIEAIKELIDSGTTTTTTKEINVEVVYSEDNKIVTNYGGTHETAIGGGVSINKGVDENTDSTLSVDDDGDWIFSPGLKVPKFTPESSEDSKGNEGNLSYDDNYLYIKTSTGWGRVNIEKF
jgi:hypothetical protein